MRAMSTKNNVITMAHGAGGSASRGLINKLILKYFKSKILASLDDAAEIKVCSSRLAFTTDGYVVNPVFFSGGNIGDIAVCGTVNDLSVKGAVPKYISAGVIIEEGFPFADLEKILQSMAARAKEAGVEIVTGDTKVVEKGCADKIFINTSGVGEMIKGLNISPANIRPGDIIIVSGALGEHGAAILNERHNLGLKGLKSDVAPLNKITRLTAPHVHMMRDLTRGGFAAAMHELADYDFEIDSAKIPVSPRVRAAAALLGIDPLQSANEGRFVCFAPADKARKVLTLIGKGAASVGRVLRSREKTVFIKTEIGVLRRMPEGDGANLPRLC